MVKYGQSDGNPNNDKKTQFQVHCHWKSFEPKRNKIGPVFLKMINILVMAQFRLKLKKAINLDLFDYGIFR